MSIKVSWDNSEQTVIRYDFTGKWDWESYEAALEQGFGMTEGVAHRVHMIVNLQNTSLPDGTLLYLKATLLVLPANQGTVIIVSGDNSARATIAFFTRINQELGKRLAVVNSLKEARKVVEVAHQAATPRMNPTLVSAS